MLLVRDGRRFVCERGHSFDVARSGYVNLLQPQERRAKVPGDAVEAVAARRRLHDRGVTGPLLAGLREALRASAEDVVLDAGCGEGFYLGSLAETAGFEGHGIDISTRAIDMAARRYPGGQWVVANADRMIPYADASFSVVMSITARMNPGEFRRVLRDDGRLVVAVPAPDDLIELRGAGRQDRVTRTIETFTPAFELIAQTNIKTEASLDAEAVRDVLVSIYRPMGSAAAEAMRVTLSLDVLIFRPSARTKLVGEGRRP